MYVRLSIKRINKLLKVLPEGKTLEKIKRYKLNRNEEYLVDLEWEEILLITKVEHEHRNL